MRKMKQEYKKVFDGKPEMKSSFGRSWCRQEDNIKIDTQGKRV
jgi:hypothetical protein